METEYSYSSATYCTVLFSKLLLSVAHQNSMQGGPKHGQLVNRFHENGNGDEDNLINHIGKGELLGFQESFKFTR